MSLPSSGFPLCSSYRGYKLFQKLFHFGKIKKFLQTHLFPRNSSVFLQPFMDRLSAWLTLLLSPGLLLTQHMSSGFDFHPVTLHLYSSRKHPVQIWLALFQSCLTQLSITPNRDNHLPTMIGHCYLAFNTTNFWCGLSSLGQHIFTLCKTTNYTDIKMSQIIS